MKKEMNIEQKLIALTGVNGWRTASYDGFWILFLCQMSSRVRQFIRSGLCTICI